MNALLTNINNNMFYILVAFGFIFLIMLFIIITMKMDISDMQRRYKKMMVGAEGSDIEKMLTEHSDRMDRITQEQKNLGGEIEEISNLLEKAITRVAIVRFDAFDNTSSEMSYCIALLDDNSTGVIISAINGREEARCYAKPIVNGTSPQYKLTQEEEQALQEASVSPVRKYR